MSRTQHTHLPDDVDFAQLRGAFDAPIAPSPRFAAQLKEELMAELTASDRIRPASIARSTRDKGQISRVQSLTATNWQGALMTAAAILAVLALSFASLRYVTNRGGDNDNTGITSGQLASATPESGLDSSPVVDGSNYIGTSNKDFADTPVLLNSLSTEGSVTASNVIGDYVIRQVRDRTDTSIAAGYIEAVSLKTGESVWTFDAVSNGNFASDGINVFAWIYTPDSSPNRLIAIDLQTGEQIWQLVDPTGVDRHNWGEDPLYIAGIVYVSTGALSVLAVDAADGSLLWNEEREEPAEGSQSTQSWLNERFTASIAILGDHIFVAWGDKTIEKLDRNSGEKVWTFQIETTDKDIDPNTDLLVDDRRVYVSITEVPLTGSTPESSGTGSYVIAIDQSEPRELWSKDWSTATLLSSSADGPLYLNSGGTIGAIDKATGEPIGAQYDYASNENFYSPFASISDDTIFLANDHSVVALSSDPIAESEREWDLATQPGYVSKPTAGIGDVDPLISSSVELWQSNLIVTTTQGQIWLIPPTASGEATPEDLVPDATTTFDHTVLGGSLGSDRSNIIGSVSPNLSNEVTELTIDNPVLRGGPVYAVVGDMYLTHQTSTDGALQAFDLNTGTLLWDFPFTIASSFASDGTRLFAFVNDDSSVRYGISAIDLGTGEELWHFADPTAVGEQNLQQGPIVANGVVYMNDGPQTFYALDAATGTQKWMVTESNEMDGTFSDSSQGFESTRSLPPEFAVDDRFFYTLTGYQFLSALDLATGSTVWTKEVASIPDAGSLNSELITNGGSLFVASAVLDYAWATPANPDDETDQIEPVYSAAKVQAFDGATGDQQWNRDVPSIAALPVVIGDSLVVARQDGFETLELADGSLRSEISYGDSVEAVGIMRSSGGYAYSVNARGNDIVIYKTDGESILQEWTIPWGTEVTSFGLGSLHAYNDGLLLTTQYGELYYIAPETVTPPVASPESDPLANGFGGADRSFNLGDEMPVLGDEAQLLVDSDREKTIVHSQVIGDLLVRMVHAETQPREYLEAIDLRTGETRWTFKNSVGRGISSDGKRVFVLTNATPGYDNLTALDLATGEVIWTVTSNQEHSFPGVNSGTVYADGIVFASFNLYSLIAVDSTSGEEIWNQQYVVQHPEHLELGILTGPSFAVQGDMLFTVWEGRIVEASDRKTGVILWSTDVFEPDEGLASQISIMADEHQVYVSGLNDSDETSVASGEFSTIVALNRTTGEANWKSPESIWMIVVASTKTSVIVNGGNQLHTIDKQTGAVSTDFYALAGDRPVAYTSAFDDSVVFTLDDTLIQFDSEYLTDVVKTWSFSDSSDAPVSTPAQSRSTTSNPSVPLRWNNQLVVSSSSGQVWLIPAAESADLLEDQVAATPPASGDPLAGGYGGADRTFNVGATLPSDSFMFESIVDFTDSPSDRAEGTYTRAQIIDGLLIRQFKPVVGTVGTLEAIDIQTQDVMWSIPMTTVAGFASDGSSLFVVDVSAGISTSMVALSLDTGAQLWSRPLELTTTGFLADSNPIYFDHFVYYSRGPQGIVAVNSATGEVVWIHSTPLEIIAFEGMPVSELPEYMASENGPADRPDAIAVDASGVYVVWANTGVQALDRETGTELWTRTMSAYSTRGVGTSSVSVTNDLVLVGVHRPEVSGEASTSMITAFGKTEGLTIWQKVTDDFVGNLAIAGTALVIPLANGTIDTYDTSDGTLLKSYTLGWDGTAPIGISSNDESFIATYWQDGAVTVEIVPLKVFAQSGTWKFTSDSATSWEYIPEAHIVGNALVFPTLEDSLWMIEPTGQGR